jgi:hypothetical protein
LPCLSFPSFLRYNALASVLQRCYPSQYPSSTICYFLTCQIFFFISCTSIVILYSLFFHSHTWLPTVRNADVKPSTRVYIYALEAGFSKLPKSKSVFSISTKNKKNVNPIWQTVEDKKKSVWRSICSGRCRLKGRGAHPSSLSISLLLFISIFSSLHVLLISITHWL